MDTSDFDYLLPPDRIAQEPAKPRDASRLLVMNRATGTVTHRKFFEIGDVLKPGDLLVVNDSRVFKARLMTTDGIEIFLLRPDGEGWIALAKPGRKVTPGSTIAFVDEATATIVEKHDDGTVVIDFGKTDEEVLAWTDRVGSVPTPPYVERPPADAETVYQTVYATNVGSVAAPTAGFHFTPELISDLKTRGIRFATVTLHVGLGTFRPIKTDRIEDHTMHEEWVDVPDETTRLIKETKTGGGRVIAVGTTTVRALESGVRHGFTGMFITPGYRFTAVDALITNFHLPKSTLLVLVSAFIGEKHADPDEGRRIALVAYAEAIKDGYRFYSFGDAMFIV
ncbi:tRNA preQ1(34) S-adenosylmethionine ribosyltransferase-isomerase QueA [Patescibacteria group bacterium]|nr:tRNA preQ1(34) S-adenosylmethionine ribosyltransferase-isomerase QueA [Patescibacteria group bacterium]MBU1448443.1 tRNA preQ1(34) S-adenosylmethionine ribosyltransferase-isomerase QueA [Patescibacteria group bacterium]MBU2612879.1 tRNA preQ1(34) S-adenosylmethionine ribosyltransferase-isomerase QueA [Patescibacteria group bacterium]